MGKGYFFLQVFINETTVHLTRKKFIYSDRYLKGGHCEKKLDRGGGPFKNAGGGVSKTNYVKLNLQTPNLHKALYTPWE